MTQLLSQLAAYVVAPTRLVRSVPLTLDASSSLVQTISSRPFRSMLNQVKFRVAGELPANAFTT